jgi:hypothetical protein
VFLAALSKGRNFISQGMLIQGLCRWGKNMCQILIKAIDQRSSDPNKDVKLYKRGYPVAVKPDDHVWGRMETLPDFVVLKVPEMTVEEANQYMGVRVELAFKTGEFFKKDVERKIRMRRWRDVQIIAERLVDHEEECTPPKWAVMQRVKNWLMFESKPGAKRLSNGKFRLRGKAVKAKISGNIPTVTRVRNWKFDVDSLPSKAINQMKAKGFVEIKKDLAVKILTEA